MICLLVCLLAAVGCWHRPHDSWIKRELREIHEALCAYAIAVGEKPTGTDIQVSLKLLGRNSKGIAYLQFPAERKTEDGAILDPWGTPYRFRPESNDVAVISAGPDKRFDTTDDVRN